MDTRMRRPDLLIPAPLPGAGERDSPRPRVSLLRIQVDVRTRSQDLHAHLINPFVHFFNKYLMSFFN